MFGRANATVASIPLQFVRDTGHPHTVYEGSAKLCSEQLRGIPYSARCVPVAAITHRVSA